MYQNIPAELRQLKQWVVSGANKIPFNPRNGTVANPIDPSTWGSFEEALRTGAPSIGFVLTDNDPFCIIDLDDKPDKPAPPEVKERHLQILAHFDSYTELSRSSTEAHKGYHIILKGSIPSGVNRDHVEIYSSGRYIIITGNVVKQLPIAEGYQATLDAMYGQMQVETRVDLEDYDDVVTDQDLFEMASTADNAEKFNLLCSANWESAGYPSGSEADLALMSMLGFYSRSNEQVIRMFRLTPLAQRMKDGKPRHSNDKALTYTLERVRSKQAPPVDLTAIMASMNRLTMSNDALPAQVIPEAPPAPPPQAISNVTLPPGLVGEVAQYVYATSIRPVPEIALATAIAFVAGIAGRAYNTNTRAGLSQYMVLLAKTGTGKEAAASAISRLLMAVRPKIPMAMDFMGPSVFASGPALHRILSTKPCFVSVLGEFGLLLQKLSNKNANTADLTLKRTLLDAYGKSGYGDMLQPSVYSDKEKDVAAIASPNITILGESTPESFYDSLDQNAVTSGFLPRFFIMEYFGERPDRNPNPNVAPSEQLLQRVANLVTAAITASSNSQCLPVPLDTSAQKLLDSFDRECDGKMRGQNDVLAEIWNRAHLKALKLASLIAVGVNEYQPLVTADVAQWAVALIRDDSSRLAARFKAGDVGDGEAKQQAEIIRLIELYAKSSLEEALSYHATPEIFKARIVSYKYLLKRARRLAAFEKDRQGPTVALQKILQSMVDSGQLVEVDKLTLLKLKFGGKAYAVGGHWG